MQNNKIYSQHPSPTNFSFQGKPFIVTSEQTTKQCYQNKALSKTQPCPPFLSVHSFPIPQVEKV